MPRQQGEMLQKDFKLGLITEATGIAYPENAFIESDNVEVDLLGTVSRRLGFDFETSYTTQAIDKTLSSITSYVWKNVSGDGLTSFVVVQIGAKLYFYNANTNPLSGGYKSSTVDMSAFEPSGGPTSRIAENQYSDGFGKLFVTNPHCEPFYVTYDANADTFTGTAITVQTRDFEGVSDGIAIDLRPTASVSTVTKTHYYNLLNQGWSANAQAALTAWDTAFTTMPSNCDVWWSYKNSSDAFDTTLVANGASGNTQAPKGHYIMSAFAQDRNTASGLTTLTNTTPGTARPSTSAFLAGRVWYAGVNASGFNQRVYFSQIIQSPTQFGFCYQNNDPTAEGLFDLEVDDGGTFDIPEAGTIYKLFAMQNVLLVFGARGIWAVRGNSGMGFVANDYTINKISSIRSISGSSYVDVNGTPMFWNGDGIFTVQAVSNQNTGGETLLQVQPMTWTTIQTFYDEIPNVSKPFVRGYFDPTTQIAQWVYKTAISQTTEDNFEFDSILVYNARSNAFYNWTFDTTNVKIHGLFVVDATGAQTVEYTVTDVATETVIDAAGDIVVANAQSDTSVSPTFKYLVSYNNGSDKITMADNQATSYLDWESFDHTGVDFGGYFISGYKLSGQGMNRFQTPYLFFYNEGVGAYDVTGIWDFATSTSTGKYTSTQRLTYNDSGYSNLHKKIKIRGSGRTLQFKINSVPRLGFKVIGWGEIVSLNQLA